MEPNGIYGRGISGNIRGQANALGIASGGFPCINQSRCIGCVRALYRSLTNCCDDTIFRWQIPINAYFSSFVNPYKNVSLSRPLSLSLRQL